MVSSLACQQSGTEGAMSTRAGCGSDADDRLRDSAHLASAVGHHLINSYSAVVSSAEMLRSLAQAGELEPAASQLADSIVATALDASRVARALIAFTRETTRPGFPHQGPPGPVDLAAVVDQTIQAESALAPPAISWIRELNPTPPMAGDPNQLVAMLRAIARNAVDAIGDRQGSISIRTGLDAEDWLFLEIRDTGSGMTPEVLKHAAEPFFTTRPGREGVGLTIAQGIWRRHQGTMAIESRPNQGTLVRLALPPASRRT